MTLAERQSAAMRALWDDPVRRAGLIAKFRTPKRKLRPDAFTSEEVAAVIEHARRRLSSEYTGFMLGRAPRAIRKKRQQLRKEGRL